MPTIKMLRSTFIKGKAVEQGKTTSVDDKTAKELVAMGKAEPAKKLAKSDTETGNDQPKE